MLSKKQKNTVDLIADYYYIAKSAKEELTNRVIEINAKHELNDYDQPYIMDLGWNTCAINLEHCSNIVEEDFPSFNDKEIDEALYMLEQLNELYGYLGAKETKKN